jgi:hypothetical protein
LCRSGILLELDGPRFQAHKSTASITSHLPWNHP